MKKIIKKLMPKPILRYIVGYKNKIKVKDSIFNSTVMFAYEVQVNNCKIRDYTSIGRFTKIVHAELGKYCALSWDITINAVSHPSNHLTVHSFPYVPSAGNFVNERKQTHKKFYIKANNKILCKMKKVKLILELIFKGRKVNV